jgi:benzoyl-CoA reductase subunit C
MNRHFKNLNKWEVSMILEKFKQIVDNSHEYAQKWKSATGGKVCGCISGNVPEEYLYAAGVLPVRILANPEITPNLAAEHIQSNRCSNCRGCLEEGLRGQYDYIDGLVYVQSCLAQSLTFSSWVLHRPLAFNYRMFRPFLQTDVARDVYREFIKDFRLHLEQWIGAPISEDSLAKSVAIYRENRQLLKQVYELRKKHPPLISGSDAQRVVLASMVMDKKEHNNLLRQLLKELQEVQPSSNERVRVMIMGSGMSPLDFTELVEKIGGDVIIEDHCLGLRYFWGDDPVNENPTEAIAEYYYDKKPQCAYQDWTGEGTMKRLSNLAKEFEIEAVIWLAQLFCGTHQWDIVDGIALFEKQGIPILKLERGRNIPKDRFTPEVEAFFEKVKAKQLRR